MEHLFVSASYLGQGSSIYGPTVRHEHALEKSKNTWVLQCGRILCFPNDLWPTFAAFVVCTIPMPIWFQLFDQKETCFNSFRFFFLFCSGPFFFYDGIVYVVFDIKIILDKVSEACSSRGPVQQARELN